MSSIADLQIEEIFVHFKKKNNNKYNEEKHCKLLIKVMLDKNLGCISAFCTQAMVDERTFYNWVNKYELFANIYFFTKMASKQLWYERGREIRDKEFQIGTMNYEFEHWKLEGWSKFGIGKNSRLKININPGETPIQNYASILRQAADGDFTASEFKQLMEAVNVGLNVHQVFELQKQIDELKSDMAVMTENTNVKNPFTNKGIEKTD